MRPVADSLRFRRQAYIADDVQQPFNGVWKHNLVTTQKGRYVQENHHDTPLSVPRRIIHQAQASIPASLKQRHE
jgi:hypothetical protein